VGHVQKSLRNSDLHINELDRQKHFSRVGGIVDFANGGQKCFAGGPTVFKFYLTNSKLKETNF